MSRYETLNKELTSVKQASTTKTGDLEKRVRNLKEENRTLKEEVEEVKGEVASQSRGTKRQLEEVETKHAKLIKTLNDFRTDLENKDNALNASQQKLSEREAELGNVEAENVRLRAQGSDPEEMVIMKREVSEQVTHIRKLESTNREQTTELRRLRDQAKTVGIVQEEKRVLEIQVERMDNLERELGEAKFQRQLLEDERSSWRSYLENAMTGDGEIEFESPEAMARALTSERSERASLFDKLGQLQPELSSREAEISSLQSEIETLKQKTTAPESSSSLSSGSEAKARARWERQKILAQKEIEYLRAQLKTFETGDSLNIDLDNTTSVDEATKSRIAVLEDLITQYRSELDKVNQALNSSEPIPSTSTDNPLKRASPSAAEDSERISVLTRKIQTLQHTLSKTDTQNRSLTSELSATKTQLTHLQSTARTRILNLRDNPTDEFTREKASTISILRQENADLHTQLSSLSSSPQHQSQTTTITDLIPKSHLLSAQTEISSLRTQLASSEKRLSRLRQIWSAKALEFRAAVASLLGWRMDFLPAGKFRLTSIFNPTSLVDGNRDGNGNGSGRGNRDGNGNGNDSDDDEQQRVWDTSFIFDGEKGTMKIAGGAEGELARGVAGLLGYWVQDRKEIPGFLAAVTLEWIEGVVGRDS